MKYELILQDNKRIILTKQEADGLTKAILDKETTNSVLRVGQNLFKKATIKGIFPISEEIVDNKERWIKENRAWNDTCQRMSKLSVDDKVTTEITNRILPGLKLNKLQMPDDQVAVMETQIRAFFDANKKYPRCPMHIWWPFVADLVAPMNPKTKRRSSFSLRMNKWWEYVARNDEAIAEWIKYQR